LLVLLTERPDAAGPVPEHEPFIDSLIQRRLVLLGGPIDGTPSVGYILRCASLDDASAVVATDPLVSSGAFNAAVAEWDLVGIDPRVIDGDVVVDGT
jgi:uncharacterized protein YciI